MPASLKIRAGSEYFVARDETCDALINATRKTNAVLLFGGRQSGKTTLLLRLRDRLFQSAGNIANLELLEVPVYVDLTSLKYDAEPRDFFDAVILATRKSCAQQISGFPSSGSGDSKPLSTGDLLNDFTARLRHISSDCGEVEPRFLFLLDEAKRVLGERFPRGFQDNLFSLLFSDSEPQNFSIAMVFAGAQHLYAFSQDDTSPIGSRAISFHLGSLSEDAIRTLAKQVLTGSEDAELSEAARFIWESSGGQAGLVARTLEELNRMSVSKLSIEVLQDAEKTILRENRGLLENWSLSLTPPSRAVALVISETDQMSIAAIAGILQEAKLESLLAPRVAEEFQYMGIGDMQDGKLVRRNCLFWSYYEQLKANPVQVSVAQEVWRLIERTELSMRELVRMKYEKAHGSKAEKVMSTVLGNKAWGAIQETKAKSKGTYKYSREATERDTMSCMYFGQLKDLMINGQCWPNFKHLFRDKRELEDKVSAVMPVRNDRAHFSDVPPKELERCRIACDDLSVIFERELEEVERQGSPSK